jgi:imidazolonepropionase-like amidohydrolase
MTAYLLRNAELLDPVAGELQPGASVRVEGDRIVDVARDGAALPVGNQTAVIDCAGRTLMPGLIDAHVHAAITATDPAAMIHRRPTRVGIEARTVLERMLRRGFTTVRDAGGLDRGLAEALELRLIRGPRVFRSGRMLSQTGGHADLLTVNELSSPCACHLTTTPLSRVADGVDAVRRAAREELKDGAHQIKVMASGGIASPADPIDMVQYTEEEIRAAVEEAEARRSYAFAHAYIPDAIVRAVRAGVRSIEHGNLLDEVAARAMAERDVFLVPTLVLYDQLAEFGRQLNFPAASMAKLTSVTGAGLTSIETAVRARVKLGFGTDLLGELHDAQSKEFTIRAEVQRPVDIIRSATTVNADLLGKTGDLGVIAPGAAADLLLVDGDPLGDIRVLGGQGDRLDLVMRAGEIITDRTGSAAP